MGPVGPAGPVVDGRLHEAISHTCLTSSAEYELALILKELRWITEQVGRSLVSRRVSNTIYVCSLVGCFQEYIYRIPSCKVCFIALFSFHYFSVKLN